MSERGQNHQPIKSPGCLGYFSITRDVILCRNSLIETVQLIFEALPGLLKNLDKVLVQLNKTYPLTY